MMGRTFLGYALATSAHAKLASIGFEQTAKQERDREDIE